MAARKRRRGDPCTPEALAEADERTLPADILLEIVARSDVCALVRCAAACKLLRRDILGPPFINRVIQQGGIVPPCILAYINNRNNNNNNNNNKRDRSSVLSLVHPVTAPAMSFLHDHMTPYMSRSADGLLGDYCPLKSRGGLLLLRRRHISSEIPDLCVYDPITGRRTFLSKPPGISPKQTRWFNRCVLLTEADGIGCSFLIFVPYHGTVPNDNSTASNTKIQTATATCGTWEHDDTGSTNIINFFWPHWRAIRHDAVILQGGGVIHWLERRRLRRHQVIWYNVYTKERGTIKLPVALIGFRGLLHLWSYHSHDGCNLLRLFSAYEFKISVWDQLSGGEWASRAVMIDMEEKLRSLDPDIPPGPSVYMDFKCSSDRSNVVLLSLEICSPQMHRTMHIILNLETKEIHKQHYSTSPSMLLEFDMPSRLRSMKVFP